MQLHQGATLQNGKYKIEQLLGQGGFGITYLASMKIEVQGPLGMITTEVKVAIKEFFMKELCNRDQNTSHVSVPSVGSKELISKSNYERYRKIYSWTPFVLGENNAGRLCLYLWCILTTFISQLLIFFLLNP